MQWNELWEMQKVCYMYKKKFSADKNDENALNYTIKSEIIVITLANLEEL